MPRARKRFNQHLSSLRVCNEHCIGLLKGRFQSLRGLRKDLNSAGTMEKITHWISACVILHNFLLSDQSPDVFTDVDDIDIHGHDGAREPRNDLGTQLRDQVFGEVTEYLES
ncbi:hypothetical protein PGT21_023889 [Puccinia graminis f. sp. tritici]|uniref:DDE Tnp4 domain-containing protein n=1 Tax=Puccinia graminis f. sp. tritici TaxID=56615 RepID=A0A5B0P8L6_PUCGR|nr:hypothetical protein PGT21_023889 [Puccinia graminis f. sp. tritici]